MHKEPQESSPLLFHNNSPVATPSMWACLFLV
jgi:hypothetical protein